MKQLFSVMLLCAAVVFSSCSKDDDENETIAVTGVSVNKTTLSLVVDATETLVATITPDNATNKNVQWKSSNATIATVSADGIVTAKTAGNTTITVTTEDGGKMATCELTVTNAVIAVTQVTLNKDVLELEEGDEETLTATVAPTDATDQTVTWTSSKPEVAIVDATGKVVAVKAGTTTITATAGTQTDQCEVTVKAPAASPYAWYKDNKTATSFQISSLEELKQFANLVNGTDKANSGESAAVNFTGKTVTLKANTTFNLNNEEWTPIGNVLNSVFFGGTFDGNGNTISGLKVSTAIKVVGFFGNVKNGTVKNLKIDGGTVTGTGVCFCGSVVGYTSNSTIENCSSSANVIGMCAGGIVGSANSSKLTACYATGNITGIDAVAENVSESVYIGGIVGEITNTFTIQVCYYTTGTVTGGKVISGKNCSTGGIAGFGSWTGTIGNSYSTGTIVAGKIEGGQTYNTGALMGSNQEGTNQSYLLYVTGKGATTGIGSETDTESIKGVAADKLAENIAWLNTNLPGSIGWSFNADGTLKKAN